MPENSEREPSDPHRPPVPGFTEALNALSNPELLSAWDLALLELEKRLLRYARGNRRFSGWLTSGWCWRLGLGQGWDKPSPLLSIPKGTCR